MNVDLTGRVALVTGSSRGLGSILARGLGRSGATVILNGRNETTLAAAVERFRKEGIVVGMSVFDISDEEAVDAAIDRIEGDYGPIEILVNNAGMQHRVSLEDFPLAEWNRIMAVNLSGAFIVGKAVARRMIKRRRGKIVNVCSLQADLGRETIAPYAASKGGLKMLTRGMCVDWAKQNIQVNALGPGYFETEMTRPLRENQEFDSWLRRRTPAGRWGDPEELIPPLLLLVDPESTFINGQLIYVDGGITASI